MKNDFDICIYISNIKHLENFQSILEIVTVNDPSYLEVLDQNMISNQKSLVKFKSFIKKQTGFDIEDTVSRIYFGNETCEHLLPSVQELRKAIKIAKELNIDFTLVTPYVGALKNKELIQLFDILDQEFDEPEVVVNDYGILYTLHKNYPLFNPILGRLLTKQKRDPRFAIYGFESNHANNHSKVVKNQDEATKHVSLENKLYREFLNKFGVNRAGFDYVPQGTELPKQNGLAYETYWPWNYITSGRNCAVASYTQKGNSYCVPGKKCKKQCQQFGFTFTSDKQLPPTIQRGNAVWMDIQNIHKEIDTKGISRIIYQPYIPV